MNNIQYLSFNFQIKYVIKYKIDKNTNDARVFIIEQGFIMNITEEDQNIMFKKGFDYIKSNSRDNSVNIANAIICLSNKNITYENAVSVFWIEYSLTKKNKDNFENIEKGLTIKIQEQLINTINKLIN